MPKKSTAIPSIQFYRTTNRSSVPAASDLKEGEIALNLATGQLYAKNASAITTIGLASRDDITTDYRITAKELVSTGATRVNGTLTVGTTANTNSNLDFGSPAGTGQIYFNTAGQFVINAIGTAGATGASTIFIRPVTSSATNQTTFRPDGLVDMPKINVGGTSTLRGDTTVSGNFYTNKAATFGSDANQSKIILDSTVTNPVIRFTGTNSSDVKAQIFGMAQAGANTALQIRVGTDAARDMNLMTDGTVSAFALQSRNNARILAADTTNWTSVVLADSNNVERGILFADKDGVIGLRNRNGQIVSWNQSNIWHIQKGSLNVGTNVGGNQSGNDPYTKGAFFNKGYLEFYGNNIAGDGSRSINMLKSIFAETPWGTQVYSERTTDGFINQVFQVSANLDTAGKPGDTNNSWFVMRHDGLFSIPGNLFVGGGGVSTFGGDINANNVQIRSDRKVKKNIVSIESALEKVMSLDGSTYLDELDNVSAGLIAQDVQEVLPEAVTEDTNGLLRLNYNAVIGLLVNAVKELKEEVKQLRGN